MFDPEKTKTTIDRDGLTLWFRRRLPVSRVRVFDAWTHPEHLRHWWDPTGTPLARCNVDLRPGGAFELVPDGDAHGPPFTGVYKQIDPPSLLVFEAMGAVGTVRLESSGEATEMTVSIACPSREHLEQFLKVGVEVGTAQTLDNLARHVSVEAGAASVVRDRS